MKSAASLMSSFVLGRHRHRIRTPLVKKSTPLSQKIAQRLIDEGYLTGHKEHYYIQRVYAGHNQRSAGAWSFTLEVLPQYREMMTGRHLEVGSQWPATELVKRGYTIDYNRFGQLVLEPRSLG